MRNGEFIKINVVCVVLIFYYRDILVGILVLFG